MPAESYPLTAILSDLHGNAPALEVALDDARRRGARRYVCLGDVVGYGAQVHHNLEWVMRLCVDEPHPPAGFGALEPGLCLQGNHEHALLNGSAEDFNAPARQAIEWTRSALNDDRDEARRYATWDFLGELRPSADDGVAMFAHGSPRDPVREYLLPRDVENEDKMRENFGAMSSATCFVGHSHVPCIYYEDGRLVQPNGTERPHDVGASAARAIVNVGSVGQPRDGDNRLSYALFDGRRVTFVRLAYDIDAAATAIRAAGLPEFLANRLAVGR